MPRSRPLGAVVALVALAASGIAGRAAAAQPPRAARAILAGVVVDSLVTGAPLAHAEVEIAGTGLAATTDERGRFRIEGVPAGRQRVTFFHHVLDSLGVGAGLTDVAVPDSGRVDIVLSTPPAGRMLSRLCGPGQPPSTGVVVGRARDAEGGGPLPGALVVASWSTWSIERGAIARRPQRVAATADSSGLFRLCGVAADVPIVVRALAGRHVSGPLLLHLDSRAFASRDIAVSLADGASSVETAVTPETIGSMLDAPRERAGSAALVGVVLGVDGRGIAGAIAGLLGSPAVTTTDARGRFRLGALPAGTQTVEVRVLGFAPTRVTRTLRVGGVDSVTVIVDEGARVLATVNVVGLAERFDPSGFEQRRRNGSGGQFLTRADIDRRRPVEVRQLFSGLAGIHMRWNGYTLVPLMSRGAAAAENGAFPFGECSPQIIIDGVVGIDPSGTDIEFLNRFHPDEIRAIEVYTSPAAVPARFRDPRGACGAILIWTRARPAQPAGREPGAGA